MLVLPWSSELTRKEVERTPARRDNRRPWGMGSFAIVGSVRAEAHQQPKETSGRAVLRSGTPQIRRFNVRAKLNDKSVSSSSACDRPKAPGRITTFSVWILHYTRHSNSHEHDPAETICRDNACIDANQLFLERQQLSLNSLPILAPQCPKSIGCTAWIVARVS
jgi:hypothetical protein